MDAMLARFLAQSDKLSTYSASQASTLSAALIALTGQTDQSYTSTNCMVCSDRHPVPSIDMIVTGALLEIEPEHVCSRWDRALHAGHAGWSHPKAARDLACKKFVVHYTRELMRAVMLIKNAMNAVSSTLTFRWRVEKVEDGKVVLLGHVEHADRDRFSDVLLARFKPQSDRVVVTPLDRHGRQVGDSFLADLTGNAEHVADGQHEFFQYYADLFEDMFDFGKTFGKRDS